ncbi:MAG: hypothetical protein R3E95_20550 [Thiolinea sp.]
MFISPNNGQIDAKKAELSGTAHTRPVNEREQRRYQYLFQSSPLHSNKSLYQHVVRLVNHFISQVMGRQQPMADGTETVNPGSSGAIRQVRGIADRMPRLVDPDNPYPSRDSIFLGEARDYPAAVIAIEYEGQIKPVFYEGNQVVARHLQLDCDKTSVTGRLILNDGSRIPIDIMIFTAV